LTAQGRTRHRDNVRPHRQPSDPYSILGVPRGASRSEVRLAYRRRALEIHPDVAGAEAVAATEAMARLNRARDQLLARVPSHPQADAPEPSEPAQPRERPGWAPAHDSAWTDHWAAWNEPRRRR
jgi:hypothetical protein